MTLNTTAETETAKIARGLRERDMELLADLVERCQHRLVRYLLYLTGRREYAEDLAQETWIRVLQRGSQYNGRQRFDPWLFAIARNLAIDYLRKNRSPEVSSTAFRTQPPNLQPASLMDMGFAVIGQLARRRMPQIRFLYIGSYVCSTLPRTFAPPQTPPHDDALALRYDFTSIRLSRGLSLPSCRTCSAHQFIFRN
jgi:RNA polymerase sigma factor (sigma-70 family)